MVSPFLFPKNLCMKKRNNEIDIAKGFGIILVIWGHTVCPVKPYFFIFHMPIFFLLSGYVFNVNDSVKATLKKKIRSLIIPFIFFLILQRIGFIIIHLIDRTFEMSHLLLWMPVYPGITIGPLWFFIALFITTICFSVINRLPHEWIKFLFALLATFSGYLLSKFGIHLPLHIDSALSMMLFFCVGSQLSRIHLDKLKSWKNRTLFSIASIMLYFLFLYVHLPAIDISLNIFGGPFILTLALMFLGCFMVLFSCKVLDYIPHIRTFMGYIGKNSLTVFAIHFMFIYALYLVFPKEDITNLGGILITFFVLGVSLLLNIPLQKYFPFVFSQKRKEQYTR